MLDVLEDEGESSNLVRENTRRYLATYQEMFRDEEVYDHKKDEAAQRCRDWCRHRVLDELVNAKASRPQIVCEWY